MNFILPRYLQKDIKVITTSPPYNQEKLLPFSDTTVVTGTFGSMLMQSYCKKDFAVYHHVFRMKRKASVKVDADQGMITLTYVLKGTIPCRLNGFGRAVLSEGWYHLYYIPAGKHIASMPAGEAVVLQVNFSPDLVRELGSQYQAVKEVCDNLVNNSESGLQQIAAEITPRIRELLNGIYSCGLAGAQLELFLRARIYDLLLLYLEELNNGSKHFHTRYHFTERDLLALHEVSALLQERLHEPLNRQVLAKYVHLHPRKLAEGFRLVYGATIHEWVSKIRIDKAKQLLMASDSPIQEIALELGYATTSVFTRAFKGMVGCTPKDYRK